MMVWFHSDSDCQRAMFSGSPLFERVKPNLLCAHVKMAAVAMTLYSSPLPLQIITAGEMMIPVRIFDHAMRTLLGSWKIPVPASSCCTVCGLKRFGIGMWGSKYDFFLQEFQILSVICKKLYFFT